ncbi:hypothetical protein NFI96_018281, partial [Prochilodus magdalenae]
DFQQHLQRLDMVLGRLQQHNLKLKLKKCPFFQTRVSYLGHVISAAGVWNEAFCKIGSSGAVALFNFELKYRPGTANRNADTLSRLPEGTDNPVVGVVGILVLPEASLAEKGTAVGPQVVIASAVDAIPSWSPADPQVL